MRLVKLARELSAFMPRASSPLVPNTFDSVQIDTRTETVAPGIKLMNNLHTHVELSVEPRGTSYFCLADSSCVPLEVFMKRNFVEHFVKYIAKIS